MCFLLFLAQPKSSSSLGDWDGIAGRDCKMSLRVCSNSMGVVSCTGVTHSAVMYLVIPFDQVHHLRMGNNDTWNYALSRIQRVVASRHIDFVVT